MIRFKSKVLKKNVKINSVSLTLAFQLKNVKTFMSKNGGIT